MTTDLPRHNPTESAAPAAMPLPGTPVRSDTHGDTVPVIVWRTVAHDPDTSGQDIDLPARLAHYLVTIYTAFGDTIADFDADDNLRDAAHAEGRGYINVGGRGGLDGQHLTPPRPITLIVMRWPRPAPHTSAQAHTLLAACEDVLDSDGSVIVAVTAARSGQPGTTYTDYEHQIVSTARAAGLRHLHDIVALDATDGHDSFTYPATDHDLNNAGSDTDAATPRRTTATTMIILCKAVRTP
ncbi:hypothetical protein Rhe02_37470 [Rhizocola hellebori]|uniref:Uncharacterized protein n=1 Tax=Rhizocola hellebori TaxID=1392758 RepID=A0A8J3VGQ0_9ACTN|nr:hypothetical protein [Rhizocola hellebori]GIH05680.1 hypothetical protein Rhe02_37470 [Rhizocola hellebori]